MHSVCWCRAKAATLAKVGELLKGTQGHAEGVAVYRLLFTCCAIECCMWSIVV